MLASDPPAAYTAVSYLLGIVISYFMYLHLQREKARAAAGDHVVETTRDVAMPDHCVRCGRPHANVPLEFRPLNLKPSHYRTLFGPRLRAKYRFWFCPHCAKPVTRLRQAGVWTMVLGAALILTLPIVFVASMRSRDLFYLSVAMVMIVFAYVLIITGLIVRMRAGSGTVSIIDNGEETVLFRFHNQVYRNHFAELNGER